MESRRRSLPRGAKTEGTTALTAIAAAEVDPQRKLKPRDEHVQKGTKGRGARENVGDGFTKGPRSTAVDEKRPAPPAPPAHRSRWDKKAARRQHKREHRQLQKKNLKDLGDATGNISAMPIRSKPGKAVKPHTTNVNATASVASISTGAGISAQAKKKVQQLQDGLDEDEFICTKAQIAKGYTFVPKGDVYVTRQCRIRTHSANKPLFIVYSPATGRRIGLGCPESVEAQVAEANATTKEARGAAVLAADARHHERARAALKSAFPRLPPEHEKAVLAHAFKKRSGRVGRTGQLEEEEKAELAVRAHVRHIMTNYDKLLDDDKLMERSHARKKVEPTVQAILRTWRAETAKGKAKQKKQM